MTLVTLTMLERGYCRGISKSLVRIRVGRDITLGPMSDHDLIAMRPRRSAGIWRLPTDDEIMYSQGVS